MKVITGDLIEMAREGRFSSIVHGCNCFSTMASGIALAIKQQFPRAYMADKDFPMSPANKLGNISSAMVEADYVGEDFRVINAYTQFRYGRVNKVFVDYEALRSCFNTIKREYGSIGSIIAYPYIGCGLAGGDWKVVSRIIDEELDGCNHCLIKLG